MSSRRSSPFPRRSARGAVGVAAAVFFGAGALLFLVRLIVPAAQRANVTGDRVTSFLLLTRSAGMSVAFIPW